MTGPDEDRSSSDAEAPTRLSNHRGLYLSKSDLVSEALRDMIVRGDLPAGTSLRHRQLAQQFRVSPTPVREALRRLESEGLVENDAQRGSIVSFVDMGEEEENYRILAVLEALACRLAVPKITERDLSEIRSLHERVKAARDGDERLQDLNREFHFRIYECANSALPLSLMRVLWRSFPGGPQRWRPHKESVRQHETLLDALERRDAEAAAAFTEAHVLGSINYMRRKGQELDGGPGGQTPSGRSA